MNARDRRPWIWTLAWVIGTGLIFGLATPAGNDTLLPTDQLTADPDTPTPFKWTLTDPMWTAAADRTPAWHWRDAPQLVAAPEHVPAVPLPDDRPQRRRQYAWFMPQSQPVTDTRRIVQRTPAAELRRAVKHHVSRGSTERGPALLASIHARSPPASSPQPKFALLM